MGEKWLVGTIEVNVESGEVSHKPALMYPADGGVYRFAYAGAIIKYPDENLPDEPIIVDG